VSQWPASGDDELLAGMRAGDEDAFRVFVSRYHQAMIRLALSYVASRAVAEEVVQETWLAMIRGLDRFEGRSAVKTWLFGILVNQARARGAAERRTVPIPDLDGSDAATGPTVDPARFESADDPFGGYWVTPPGRFSDRPEEQLTSAEIREVIEQAIAALPPRQQQVITLRDVEGWDAGEVCQSLGITEGNQRVLLHRARARVRSGLAAGVNGDQVGITQPGLLPLGNHGGPTDTVALQADSPAIGAGSVSTCQSAGIGNADQRGDTRNAAGRGACDIGAYDTAGNAVPDHVYYVAPGGTDTSGTCAANTKANAFPQIGTALACAVNGDTVSVAAGTSYSGIGTIADNITIAGAGARRTRVNAAAGPLTVAAGADVTISGITLTAATGITTAPIVTDNGILTLTRDTITGDQLNTGILIRVTTGAGSSLALNGTTVSDNFGTDGGAIEALGSAIGPLQVSLVNSTLSGNTAEFVGGGLFVMDLTSPPAVVSLVNSTISGNSVLAGGLAGGIITRGATISLSNTIVAGNTAPGSSSTVQDCIAQGGGFADGAGGHNLIGDIGGCTGLTAGVNGDKTGAPVLGALASNGGQTNTLALLAGSPAIAAGNATTCARPPVSNADQRGSARHATTRGSCDIGAYDTGGATAAK